MRSGEGAVNAEMVMIGKKCGGFDATLS